MVRKTIADETWVAFYNFWFDWVHRFIFCNLHLGISPTRDLDNHVKNAPMTIGKKRDIMQWRDNMAVLFDEHTML